MKEVTVLLHNIRSAHNVGSIFRTADAAGISHIYLSGYTPTPRDRFGRSQKEIAKTALGAEKDVPWEHHTAPMRLLSKLKKDGWKIVCVEQDARARDYRSLKIKKPTLFVFGNEVRGVPKNILKTCDSIVEIPMHGRKESLNVSVAAGIILFSVR
ncbi:MAG: RNA methyltransferase [bacterium]|nr:RNA methyltransferase [bacterium]